MIFLSSCSQSDIFLTLELNDNSPASITLDWKHLKLSKVLLWEISSLPLSNECLHFMSISAAVATDEEQWKSKQVKIVFNGRDFNEQEILIICL